MTYFLLLSTSSQHMASQVIIGIISAILFYIFFVVFHKERATSGDKTDSINNIYDKIKKYDAKHPLPLKSDKTEDKLRLFIRNLFDNNCVDIVLSCQNLPNKEMFTEICMKILEYYTNDMKKEPKYDEMRQMAIKNNVDWDNILEEEYKRVIEIYEDPFDYV